MVRIFVVCCLLSTPGADPSRTERSRDGPAFRLPVSSTCSRTCRLIRAPRIVDDHVHPGGRVDQGDQADQRTDLIVVVVLAHLAPGLVGHTVVAEPGAFLGECQRGPLGLGEHGAVPPGGDQVEPERGFTGGRRLLGVGVDAETAAVDLADPQLNQFPQSLRQRRPFQGQRGAVEPLGDLRGRRAVEQVETRFHDVVLTRDSRCRVLLHGTNTRCRRPGPCDGTAMWRASPLASVTKRWGPASGVRRSRQRAGRSRR